MYNKLKIDKLRIGLVTTVEKMTILLYFVSTLFLSTISSELKSSEPSIFGCGSPPIKCLKTSYRSIDGSCNNLKKPMLGTPQTRYARLLPPNYGDGISSPTLSKTGEPLPPSRLVSMRLYEDIPLDDDRYTLNAMQYGQIITHDMSLATGSGTPPPRNTSCCKNGQIIKPFSEKDRCMIQSWSKNDILHPNLSCLSFIKTETDGHRNCTVHNKPVEQLTRVNHYLDLSIIYANTDEVSRELRELKGGRLKVERRHGTTWPVTQSNTSLESQGCCYRLGDLRANQNTHLTLLHIVFLREHNRIADILAKLNPKWGDEKIFQEARRIVIAEHQYISYYEWLPIFIGRNQSIENKIIYLTKDFVDDYSEDVEPTVLNEHANAAFRFYHAMIAGQLRLYSEARNVSYNLRLSDWFNKPKILEKDNNFDELCRGLSTEPTRAASRFHDNEITNFLFRNESKYGADLKTSDIERNRDHGFAPYNDYREYCGLPKAKEFKDFSDVIPANIIEKLSSLYKHPDDVELTVGGSVETLVPGTLAGPTFLCILKLQFWKTRVGDRFWFEHKDNGFTLEQLNEIRKSSISRLLCDNGLHIQTMQPKGLEKISSEKVSTIPSS